MLNIDRKYLISLDKGTLKKTTTYHASHCYFTAVRRDFLPD